MARRYAILDVFTDTALEGNPLAVVLDGDGLSTERMQAIAREFNLSETVFVTKAERPAHSAKLRIFTPARELPFAGHPTVGTAVLLTLERWGSSVDQATAVVVLEEEIGSIRVGVNLRGSSGYAEFDLPQLPQQAGEPAEREDIAAALGLSRREIGFENHIPSVFSAGITFHFVPVADLATLRKATPQRGHWDDTFHAGHSHKVFVYTREVVGKTADFQARMFAPTMGIEEDPATGSAVAAFAGVIQKFDKPLVGTHKFEIEQGFEMMRPSILNLELDISKSGIDGARIGGNAVLLARGELMLD